ncbi:hypothetical protein ACOMHN_009305 [Nucella lapillus]
MAAAFTTTTHHPHSTPSMVGGELDHQIRAEVKVLLQQDPNLNVDNCSTKCDALFDLVSHHHEKTTDELCLYKCRGMWKSIFGIVFFIAACVWVTGGLKCLQCLDTSKDGPCIHDYEGLVNASKGVFSNGSRTYYKECPDGKYGVEQNYCVIEVFYRGGQLASVIRDCSDGSNFSFTGDANVDSPKLGQILPDNFTTCVYRMISNAHICLTLCQDDFCNGPLAPNKTESCNESDVTCGAGQLLPSASGPFGAIVDRVLGRGYFVPLLATVLCVLIFGETMPFSAKDSLVISIGHHCEDDEFQIGGGPGEGGGSEQDRLHQLFLSGCEDCSFWLNSFRVVTGDWNCLSKQINLFPALCDQGPLSFRGEIPELSVLFP